MECWTPIVTELPMNVTKESRNISREPSLFYPYWLVPVRTRVKLPFLPARESRAEVAVDAFNGGTGISPRVGTKEEAAVNLPPLPDFPDVSDGETVLQVSDSCLPPKLRMWGRVESTMEQARLICKELRVFNVEFKNGASARIALDTLSGNYGVLKPGKRR